jgi:hypothetical protein
MCRSSKGHKTGALSISTWFEGASRSLQSNVFARAMIRKGLMASVAKHRVLVLGVLSPYLALVSKVIVIQLLLA